MKNPALTHRDQGRDHEAEKLELDIMNIRIGIGSNCIIKKKISILSKNYESSLKQDIFNLKKTRSSKILIKIQVILVN